jgi:SAM-dependent methyltransferase
VAGAHALAWEQTQIDHWVSDAFGYHAVQLGLPELDALRHNRMPHRWVLQPQEAMPGDVQMDASRIEHDAACGPSPGATSRLFAEFHALPFPASSLDLVVMPHTLETAADAHQTLREVERVLRPEGRLLITGFNPASLWGLARRRATWSPQDWIGYWRLRDWLRLLSFEVEGGRFGCYVPPVSRATWLERLHWMESVGDRWWPVLGGVYAVMAVKRVRGMRVVGLSRKTKARTAAAPAVAAHGRHRVMPMSGAPVLPPKREEGGA